MIDVSLLHLCSTLRVSSLSTFPCSAPLPTPTYRGGGGADVGRSGCSTCSAFAPPQSTKVEHHSGVGFLPGHALHIINLQGCKS